MKTVSLRLFALAVLSAFALGTVLHAEPVLVGHPGLKGQTLDAEGVKAVLLGRKVVLGSTRVVIVIEKSSAAQDAFLQAHLGMTTSQFQNHWRRLFMTGGGSAPKIVENETDAIKVGNETPGAVFVADAASAGDRAVLGK